MKKFIRESIAIISVVSLVSAYNFIPMSRAIATGSDAQWAKTTIVAPNVFSSTSLTNDTDGNLFQIGSIT